MTLPLAGAAMMDYVQDRLYGWEQRPPSLNSSLAHLLLTRSAAHVRIAHPRLNPAWQPQEASRFDLGAAAHAVLLEGRRDLLAVCNFADWRTKLAQQARDDARANGQIPVLLEQAAAIEGMVDAAQATLAASPDLKDLGPLDAERTLLWQDGPTWLRSRPDWLARDYAAILSYKTTAASAEPGAFQRIILGSGYHVQAAFELAGIKAKTGKDAAYVWLVQEVDAPFACSLLGMTPEFRAFAETARRKAVSVWAECLATDCWPAYPNRICYLDLPPWAQAGFIERHGLDVPDDGRPIEEQMFEKGIMP
jgi:hypothetical protein